MNLSFFDTHCDTISELYFRHEQLNNNNCHVSLDAFAKYKKYAQCFAIWTNSRWDEETGYQNFLAVSDYFKAQTDKYSDRVMQVRTPDQLDEALNTNKCAAILAVEDARLLNNDITRLDELYRRGVRYLTLMWAGDTCVGGSHNTENGLTEFGKQVAEKCFQMGIIPDVSHSSAKTVDDLSEIAFKYNKPFIATHSNSHALCPHTRNLRDRHFETIKQLGGIVGMNMFTPFLTDTNVRPATVDDIYRHIDHFMELGGQDVIGFGGDFDGIDGFPQGMNTADEIYVVADILASHSYSDELINKIFFDNFYKFFKNNLPKEV